MHKGPVVFVDGVHYAVGEDGHADKDKPLRWTEDGYRAAEADDQLHNDAYAGGLIELEPGSEDA